MMTPQLNRAIELMISEELVNSQVDSVAAIDSLFDNWNVDELNRVEDFLAVLTEDDFYLFIVGSEKDRFARLHNKYDYAISNDVMDDLYNTLIRN